MASPTLRAVGLALLPGLLLAACERPAGQTATTSEAALAPPGAPQPAPPPPDTRIIPPVPLEAEPPAGDSTEVAISEELWARLEHGRDLAFRSVGPEPFIPFALYDTSGDQQADELRRYSGGDIQIVLATARRDMARHAHSSYVIAHHGSVTRDDQQSPAVILEGCERVTGDCHRFAQPYRFRPGAAPELVGNLLYLGPCLSAFNVTSQPATGP